MPPIACELVQAVPAADLERVAAYMLPLMLRNVSSDGFAFVDPRDVVAGGGAAEPVFSLPGCIIASPSFPADLAAVDQNYVDNWVRDAAIAAMEIAEAEFAAGGGPAGGPRLLRRRLLGQLRRGPVRSGVHHRRAAAAELVSPARRSRVAGSGPAALRRPA